MKRQVARNNTIVGDGWTIQADFDANALFYTYWSLSKNCSGYLNVSHLRSALCFRGPPPETEASHVPSGARRRLSGDSARQQRNPT